MNPPPNYTVTRSPRRRTLAIEVRPDLSVAVLAPADSGDGEIAEKIVARRRWIARQQDHFRRYHPLPKTPRYVSGETHYHLGRQYRLRIASNMPSTMVGIEGEYLEVLARGSATPDVVARAVDAWYRAEARRILGGALDSACRRLRAHGISRPLFRLRAMPGRWGSCSPTGVLLLHPDLVRVPSHCIEYVLVHELCHLRYHDHGRDFQRLLQRVMSDWRERKRQLETWSSVLPLA